MGDVPCGGCSLCCRGDAIRLLPGDDATTYLTVPHSTFPGHLMLDHKPNGDCIYLSESGCGIHERKPQMCKSMDCRNIARAFTWTQMRKMNVPMKVWRRGKELLEVQRGSE